MHAMDCHALSSTRRVAAARRAVATLVLALLSATFLLSPATSASADVPSSPTCVTKAMYVVAHEDDSLLFQSPDLLQDIRSGRCVRTVFLTAGDDGKGESYWITREEGAEAGYARMAGEGDEWEASSLEVDGHPLHLETLEADPRLSLVFMRLPDGGYPAGEGTPPHLESLMKLWNGGNGGSPSESDIGTVEEEAPATYATTYDFDELVDTLAALMTSFEPRWIATQNYAGTFTTGVDHHDHVATAKFTQRAQGDYAAPHQLIAYEDYETSSKAKNVSGAPLKAKEATFAAYEEHDEACTEGSECKAQYQGWLERQYQAASATTGVVANAGHAQTVDSGDMVGLDGSRSSAEGGGPLTYAWTQTAGPTVELSDASMEKPSFVAPPAAASLSFALTVSKGLTVSEPDVVSIEVEGPNPTPTALAGPAQSVASSATVTLNGSASVNPYRQPLEYEWTQIAGPAVGLAHATSATPSFTAPVGPASLAFSLVVSNPAGSSPPATVAVAVAPPPSLPTSDPGTLPPGPATAPTFTTPATRYAIAGRRLSVPVRAAGVPAPVLALAGSRPAGLRLEGLGPGAAALSGRLRRAGRFRLTVLAQNSAAAVRQHLTLVVRCPQRSGARGSRTHRRSPARSPRSRSCGG
jgi:LmbE family N-acetylglucosaminyl deacetylase